MKKTQLRKKIRESIKKELGLLNEQANPNARYIQISTCWGANTRYRHATVDGGVPQVGQMIDWTTMNRTWFITAVQTTPWTSPQGVQNIGSYQGTTCCPHLCGTSVNQTPVWTTNNPNYGMTGMNNVGCSGNGNMCCGNANYAANTGSNCTSSCDTTPASACAQQWFQNPNATWAANWINNRDCSNYNWPGNNLPVQALQLMSSAPNPQPGPYNSWNDIWTKANAAWPNTTGAPKNTFIGKMAKGRYAECQIAACNC